MIEDYKTLKLNEEEFMVVKNILCKTIANYLFEKNKEDFEEKVAKDYNKYQCLNKEKAICERILYYMRYLER